MREKEREKKKGDGMDERERRNKREGVCVRACVRARGGRGPKINKTNKEGVVVVVVVCVCVCGRACVCVRARGERHPRAQLIERGRERVVRDGERTPCQEAFFLVCVFVIVGAFAPTHPHTHTQTPSPGAGGQREGRAGTQGRPHRARPHTWPDPLPAPPTIPPLSPHTHTHTRTAPASRSLYFPLSPPDPAASSGAHRGAMPWQGGRSAERGASEAKKDT